MMIANKTHQSIIRPMDDLVCSIASVAGDVSVVAKALDVVVIVSPMRGTVLAATVVFITLGAWTTVVAADEVRVPPEQPVANSTV